MALGVPNPEMFEVGDLVVTARDVVAAAEHRGALAPSRLEFLAGVAAEEQARREGKEPDESDVEERANAFRYERSLITAEEAEAWLRARGLSFDDLLAFCRREHWRARIESAAPPAEGLPESFFAHLILSGEMGRQSLDLARRLSVADEVGPLDPERLRAMEDAYERRCREFLTAEERERLRQSLRLPLMRVDLEILDVPSLEAAREAILCVREDGVEMAALAAENGFPHVRAAVFLEDLGEDRQRALLSAAHGDLLDPIDSDGRVRVCRVVAKREPDLADPEVLERIDRLILDTHFAELTAKRVRWRLRDEPLP